MEVTPHNYSKKVLIIVENCYVPLDIRVWYEATTLRDAGWQVTVICPAPTGSPQNNHTQSSFDSPVDLESITVHYFQLKAATHGVLSYLSEYLAAYVAISRLSWRIWRRGRFDILHVCNPPDMFFLLALCYRILGARVIFDHHDLVPEFIQHRYQGPLGIFLSAIARIMEFLTFRCAHIIISTNETYRKIALKRGFHPEHRVIVVRNGPKISEFNPVKPDQALKKGFPFLVCYVGVMGFEDGVLEMVDSIRYIINDRRCRNILFALIGDGSVRLEAQQRIQEWGLSNYVDMPGMIHDKLVIRRYLSTSDVCLCPEPLSPLNAKSTFVKVGEYMAIGKPVVAYDLEETHWTAQEAALYVQPGDIRGFGEAIVTLLAHPEKRLAMGEYGRKRILDQLGWEHQQKNLLKAYDAALHSS